MRSMILTTTFGVSCLAATAVLAIPPGQAVRSYKSPASHRSPAWNTTPSYSPGLPMGATGQAVSPWLKPGSVVPGQGGYYPPRPNRPYPGSGYYPGYGHYPGYPGHRPPGYRPPGYRPGYPYDRYPIVLPYYCDLHYHWRPSWWTRPYRPVFYNYGYSTVGGTWLSVGGTSLTFVNPFLQPGFGFQFDYSRPIRVPDPSLRESEEQLIRSERAIRRFDDAREWFRRGEYVRAGQMVEEAIALLPNDPTLHQFRALVLFARGRYQESAAVLYSVLAVSPGWDASTITSLYGDTNRYLLQVNQLAQYAANRPDSVDAQFLLAYHYAIKGDLPGAERQLQRVLTDRPGDRVVLSLLEAIRG